MVSRFASSVAGASATAALTIGPVHAQADLFLYARSPGSNTLSSWTTNCGIRRGIGSVCSAIRSGLE